MRYYCFGKQVFASVVASGGKEELHNGWLRESQLGTFPEAHIKDSKDARIKCKDIFLEKTPIFGKIKTPLKNFWKISQCFNKNNAFYAYFGQNSNIKAITHQLKAFEKHSKRTK